LGLIGCELVAAVDRDDIPPESTTPTGVGGGGGGGGTGGTAYAMHQFAEEDSYDAWTGPLPAMGADAVTMAFDLIWHDGASRPLPYDLSVELDGVGDPLIQVFAIDDGPLARIGTRVVPLRPGVEYRAEISRTAVAAWARILRVEDDEVLLSGAVVEIVEPPGQLVTVRTAKESSRVRLENMRVWRDTSAE
jgi:hypothetical protein